LLLAVLVTAAAVVTMLQITPHHSYYCCGLPSGGFPSTRVL